MKKRFVIGMINENKCSNFLHIIQYFNKSKEILSQDLNLITWIYMLFFY